MPRCCPPAYGSRRGRRNVREHRPVRRPCPARGTTAGARTSSEHADRGDAATVRPRCQSERTDIGDTVTQPRNVVKVCYRERSVERVPGRPGEPRDELGRLPARHAGARRARRRPRAPGRPVVHDDLAPRPSTSVISPFGGSREPRRDLARGPAHDLLEPLRQLAADRDRPRPAAPPPASASDARQPPRRLERDDRHAASARAPRQSAASAASPRGR